MLTKRLYPNKTIEWMEYNRYLTKYYFDTNCLVCRKKINFLHESSAFYHLKKRHVQTSFPNTILIFITVYNIIGKTFLEFWKLYLNVLFLSCIYIVIYHFILSILDWEKKNEMFKGTSTYSEIQ